MNTKFKAISLFIILLLCFSIASGCAQTSSEPSETAEKSASESTEPSPSNTAEEEPEASEEPSDEPEPSPTEPEYIILGNEDENSAEAVLENKTGETIVSISVKLSDEDEFGKNLLPENTEFQDGEFAKLYLEPLKFNTEDNVENARGDAEESENGISENNVEFNDYYDIKIVFDNKEEYILYDFSFDNIGEAKIMLSKADNVCYLKYESKLTGEQVNTLEAQKAMKTALQEEDEEESTSKKSTSNKLAQAESEPTAVNNASESAQAPEPAQAAPEPVAVPDSAPAPAPEQYVDDCLEENVEFFD